MHLAVCFQGEVINKEKLTKETKILQEIVLLQEAAENYRLQPHDQFLTWFQDLELISMEESFVLSFQREPPFEAFFYHLRQEGASLEATVHPYFNISFSCACV
ncbi:ral-GDS-related protein-like isoform X1 [Sorex araneus]|uniref:ral-GDS-related protein-like isoform X1 n=1 Tax=Sorex araneus TaxID=42254 RepID=UPI002433EB8C|nr:ral-GDS-related protein-like isoform X1 [Sorex araneus]